MAGRERRWPGWLGRLSPPRRRLHLGVLGLVLAVLAVGAVAAATGGDEPDAVDQARRGPIVLVPGYGGGTAALQSMAEDGLGAGTVVVFDPPGDGTGDLREQAEALADLVDGLTDESGAPSVDLVGYSAGGVVVRLFVAELGGDEQVRRVVTLASPQHGTDLASLAGELGGACPEACRQLDPDSDVLRSLNRDDETPAGPRWLSLWTEDDEIVVPPDSGALDGAVSASVQQACDLGPVAHGEVPRRPEVIGLVRSFLGGDGDELGDC